MQYAGFKSSVFKSIQLALKAQEVKKFKAWLAYFKNPIKAKPGFKAQSQI